MPFNKKIANRVLAENVGDYIGLFTAKPTDDGGYVEPTIDNSVTGNQGGYKRGFIGAKGWNKSKDRQIANSDLILMFEAREALGTKVFTHFGLFSSASNPELIFYGELANSLTVSTGYVPLVRAYELIIAMDVDAIDTNYGND